MATTLTGSNTTEYLNNAKKYLLDCYNQKTFVSLSDIPFADVFDVNKKATNPEIIFRIAYKQGDPYLFISTGQEPGKRRNHKLFISFAG